MPGVRKQREPFSMIFVARSTQRSRLQKLTRFLEYPELELSNNLAENSMRGVALGRKNWIHIGSPKAGPKVAAILCVVESCRRLHFSARKYLASVLPGIVVDFIHVAQYVWKAAGAFFPGHELEQDGWTRAHLLEILRGKGSLVAAGMRRSATLRKMAAAERKPVDECADYLLHYSPYLQYDNG